MKNCYKRHSCRLKRQSLLSHGEANIKFSPPSPLRYSVTPCSERTLTGWKPIFTTESKVNDMIISFKSDNKHSDLALQEGHSCPDIW